MNTPQYHIIDYVVGPAGSVHDATVFRESKIATDPQSLLGFGEFSWVDSAYALTEHTIPPFKKPESAKRENGTFNYHLSHVC